MNGGFFCKQINKITDIIKKIPPWLAVVFNVKVQNKIIKTYFLLKIIRRIFLIFNAKILNNICYIKIKKILRNDEL